MKYVQFETYEIERDVSKAKLFFYVALFIAFAIWGPGEW